VTQVSRQSAGGWVGIADKLRSETRRRHGALSILSSAFRSLPLFLLNAAFIVAVDPFCVVVELLAFYLLVLSGEKALSYYARSMTSLRCG